MYGITSASTLGTVLQDVVFVLLQSGVIAVVVVVVVVTLWTPLPAAAEPIATAAKVQYQSILRVKRERKWVSCE